MDLLGPPRWRRAEPTEAGLTSLDLSAQDAALIGLLALQGPQGRDRLAGQVWPDATQQQAANNLRKHVSRLRKESEHPIFETGATLSLRTDVRVEALDVAGLAVDRLLDDEFLAGCDFGGNDFLHRWAEESRLALRSARADALAGHAERLEKRDELAAAIRLAERVVALAPLQEHAWRRLMRLHYLRGDHTAAIESFERFERQLREETGARPGPETQRLLSTIERGSQGTALPLKVLPVSLVKPPRRVGREAEWLAMGRAWDGERAFLLLGDAGIGKSRLLSDFVQGRHGVVMERARAGDAQSPFEVLSRLLRNLLVELPLPQPKGGLRQELSRLLPELGPAPQSPAPEGRLRRAAEELLIAAAGVGLTVLIVDDLHFADLATLDALRWLTSSPALASLRFGFGARPLDQSAAGTLMRSWLDDSQRPERIEVQPLAPHDVDELLTSLQIPEFTAQGLATRLHAHAGGHPLFTLETLKDAWLHRRDLRADALPAPQTVQTLIERRLRELPADATDLVRVAAVAGADFNAARAASWLGCSPLQLAGAWSQLERTNILVGQRFTHDLMQEGALAMVPRALRRALHAMVAELLGSDASVPPARVADHWQAAERWAEAGRWWHRAGMAARTAGRLQEQQTLLERAAACHRQAGDHAGEFDAVHATCDSQQLRHGGSAVLATLPRLQQLVGNDRQRLQCQLVEAEALLDQERSSEALEVASAAVRAAQTQPMLTGDALCLHSMALAQLGRADEARRIGREAADAAHAAGMPEQEFRAVRSLAYVLYKIGDLQEALPAQRRALDLALVLGDEAETAAAHAAVAALQAAAGDVLASLEHARLAHRGYTAMGLAQNSTSGLINLVTLGRGAAFVGQFGEALEALTAAERMAGDGVPAGAQAKTRIALALLLLILGAPGDARALLTTLPTGTPPGMRMQAALALARAEQMEGGTGAEHLARLTRLDSEHPALPMMLSAWIEWSYQGDAEAVTTSLRDRMREFEAAGRPGTARTLAIREVARLCDIGSVEALARAQARARLLVPAVGRATCASLYPPEAWLVLELALQLGGADEEALACRRAAQRWIREIALPNVPTQWRKSFLDRNPFNRRLLAGAEAELPTQPA